MEDSPELEEGEVKAKNKDTANDGQHDLSKNKQQEDQEGRIISTKLIVLFIVGALIGITLKTHAIRTITMGFDDYKLQNFKDDFLSADDQKEQKDLEVESGDKEEDEAVKRRQESPTETESK